MLYSVETISMPTQESAIHMIHLPAAWEHCENLLSEIYQDNPEVREGFLAFSASLKKVYEDGEIRGADIARIIRGIEFSADKHQFQTRKNERLSPYIVHPMSVANRLMNIGNVLDADTLIGALLHDTVEDTKTTFEEIRLAFGEKVEGIVREVTDDRSLSRTERKQRQIDNAPHKSPSAAMVKMADKLDNLSDMLREPPQDGGQPWPKERLDAYLDWAQKVVNALPPANPGLKEALDQVFRSRE